MVMFFSGVPKCGFMYLDHVTLMPMLDGANGSVLIPRFANSFVHAPSDPSCAQLAPPTARMVAFGVMVRGPLGVLKKKLLPVQPLHCQRVWSETPLFAKRVSHARSKGEAFIALGKTRRVEPMNVVWPSASLQFITAKLSKAVMQGRSQSDDPQ